MSEYLFGLSYGWLPKKADTIAQRYGAYLVNYTDPQCQCGHGCAAHECKRSRRHWFAGPNRGAPYDREMSQKVMAALREAGIIGEGGRAE